MDEKRHTMIETTKRQKVLASWVVQRSNVMIFRVPFLESSGGAHMGFCTRISDLVFFPT